MEYSENIHENEQMKEKNGQRNIITYDMYTDWASEGMDFTVELLLDIANGNYQLADFINDVKSYERN